MMLNFKSNISFESKIPIQPLVFLPAFPLNNDMWTPQLNFLEDKNISYLAVNYPGFGNRPLLSSQEQTADMDSYALDIGELLERLHISRAIFIGLSMGGYVALALYRKLPELFAGLVLADTRASADDETGRQKRMKMIQDLQQTKNPLPIFEQHLSKFFTQKTQQENKKLIEFTRSLMEKATVPAIISAQQAMASRLDSFDLLPKMEFPVLLIAGAQDELTTVDDARKMAESLRDADLKIIDYTAHLSNLEEPELFNLYLLNYLERFNKIERERQSKL